MRTRTTKDRSQKKINSQIDFQTVATTANVSFVWKGKQQKEITNKKLITGENRNNPIYKTNEIQKKHKQRGYRILPSNA